MGSRRAPLQATASPGFEFDNGAGLAPLEASATPGMGKLKVPIPSLRLTSLESSPISTAKPTRSERRQAAYSSKPSFSVSTPVRAPLPLKPFEATPPNSQRSEEQPEVSLPAAMHASLALPEGLPIAQQVQPSCL